GPTWTGWNVVFYATFEVLPAALQALFVAMALWWPLQDWRADLVDSSRLLRAVLLVAIGVDLVSYTLLTRLVIAPDNVVMLHMHEAYMAFNALLGCAIVALLFYARDQRPAASVSSTRPTAVDPTEAI